MYPRNSSFDIYLLFSQRVDLRNRFTDGLRPCLVGDPEVAMPKDRQLRLYGTYMKEPPLAFFLALDHVAPIMGGMLRHYLSL